MELGEWYATAYLRNGNEKPSAQDQQTIGTASDSARSCPYVGAG